MLSLSQDASVCQHHKCACQVWQNEKLFEHKETFQRTHAVRRLNWDIYVRLLWYHSQDESIFHTVAFKFKTLISSLNIFLFVFEENKMKYSKQEAGCFFLSVCPECLGTLVEHWEAKNNYISINNWKHMKSNFTCAVIEQEAASQFLQNDRSKSQAWKCLVGEA